MKNLELTTAKVEIRKNEPTRVKLKQIVPKYKNLQIRHKTLACTLICLK